MISQAWAVFLKDIRMEFRGKEALNAALAFALVLLILFSFVGDPASDEFKELSGGLLWILFAFSGVLLVNRGFAREQGNDCLEVLLASRVRPAALLVGKTLANALFLLLVEAICVPVFTVLYNIDLWKDPFWLIVVVLLATWSIAIIGTVFSAMTVNLRLRELMLPVIVYPMIIPALAAAMQLTTLLATGRSFGAEDWIWVKLLIGFDVIFTALSLGLIDTILVD